MGTQRDMVADFAAFWETYPRRVGKLAAMRAYSKARSLASAAEILDGLARALAHFPADLRFVPHAASWLNAGRWLDEHEPVRPARPRCVCPHTPPCNSKVWCQVQQAREAER
jgi:hypothetical protein